MSSAPASPSSRTGRVVAVSSVAALGGFLFGFDSSVINGAVPWHRRRSTTPRRSQTGFVVSVALLGCAVGAWYAGRVADRLGRIRVMSASPRWCSSSRAPSARRSLETPTASWSGASSAASRSARASVIAPTYIAEVAPAHLRGRLGSLQQLAIVTGIFLALLSDYVIATAAGGASAGLAPGDRGVALDVPRRGDPGRRLRPGGPHHPREPALPHRPRPRGRGSRRHGLGRAGARPRRRSTAVRTFSLEGERAQKVSRPARTGATGCCRSCGWADHALGAAAVRRDQRDLLLLQRSCGRPSASPRATRLQISVISPARINIGATIVAILAASTASAGARCSCIGSAGMSVSLLALAYLFGTAPLAQVAATATCESSPCLQPTLSGGGGHDSR